MYHCDPVRRSSACSGFLSKSPPPAECTIQSIQLQLYLHRLLITQSSTHAIQLHHEYQNLPPSIYSIYTFISVCQREKNEFQNLLVMHTHYVCHQNNRQISLINNIILFRRFSYDRNYAYIVNITLPRSRSPNHTIATEPRRGERRKTLNVGMFSSSASLRLLLAAEGDGNGGGKC